ncbi:hypothetical protein ACFQPA_08635 [Halomarina halobia]|uniref:Uncharacterized protein n=1 Tax=Halomarina halobia TaxID=3033386 RepID=A0ABD6AC92_9EURY|nr:hypothetical protein [Halomarina sp. PSR21]
MTSHVYTLHSTLELPLEDVFEYFEDADLPVEIADVEITRRNNTLIVSAVAAEDNISKYTPTAQLKASVTENRVYLDEDEEDEAGPFGAGGGPSGTPQWAAFGQQEEQVERPSELVEYACFKGDRETVLQNTALQYPMFEVLCDLALECEKGTLTAITSRDGELQATRIVNGEERAATLKVVEDPRDAPNGNGINWRDNKFIS